VKEADVAIIIEVWDRADAPSPGAPRSDDLEIGIEMFQYLRANDRIVVVSVRSGIKRVPAKKQLGASGATSCVADRDGTEVEATIDTVVLLQNDFRQEAIAASNFEDETAATSLNTLQDSLKKWVV
jgi:hypothetical protein